MSNKTNKFGIGKFLVMALVLGGGLVYGTQMVQKNQENRSSAAPSTQLCKCSNPAYKTIYLCIKNKAKWVCPQTTKTPIDKCSNSNCGSCFKSADCNIVGCVWNSKTNTCVKKSLDKPITPGEKVVCTSVMYSIWSPCKNGVKTRTIFEKNPSGCTVENPILSESCTVCTSVTYTSWSSCVNGFQTREISEKSPSGCTLDNPVIVQKCTKVVPTREISPVH